VLGFVVATVTAADRAKQLEITVSPPPSSTLTSTPSFLKPRAERRPNSARRQTFDLIMAFLIGNRGERLVSDRVSHSNGNANYDRTFRIGDFSFDAAACAVDDAVDDDQRHSEECQREQ
jgi:hypothetical protein